MTSEADKVYQIKEGNGIAEGCGRKEGGFIQKSLEVRTDNADGGNRHLNFYIPFQISNLSIRSVTSVLRFA